MSHVSAPAIAKDATLEACVVYRAFFEASGAGLAGLTLLLKITNTAGANITPLTLNTHWKFTELTNIVGDYEVLIKIKNILETFGQYTVEIDSQHPAGGKLVSHFTQEAIFGKVNDAAPSTLSFITDLASATTDFYKRALLLMITGSLAGCGPSKVIAFNGSTKLITLNTSDALPASPANGDIFYLIRY